MRAPMLLLSALTMTCLLSAGCAPRINLGPQESTDIVLVHAGKPCRVNQNIKAKVRAEGAKQDTEQDLGGGYWMPSDHWDACKTALEEYAILKTDPELAGKISAARKKVQDAKAESAKEK